MKKMLFEIQRFFTKPVIRQWVRESEKFYPRHSIRGFTVYCPEHLVATLELTFGNLREDLPEVYDLIQRQTPTIYGHLHPMEWLAFGNPFVFISVEGEAHPAFYWKEGVGYLASNAKINEMISNNRLSVMLKWSKARKEIGDFEKEVIAKLTDDGSA